MTRRKRVTPLRTAAWAPAVASLARRSARGETAVRPERSARGVRRCLRDTASDLDVERDRLGARLRREVLVLKVD
jgi:hypothetical protein